jgi:ABC-2 type transport system ATP-binding protein
MGEAQLAAAGVRYRTPAGERGPVDLAVAAGEIVCLRMPGAEFPSALLHVLCTLDAPLAGRLMVAGHDTATALDAARRALAFLPQEGGYEREETPEQILRRVARWRRTPPDALAQARSRFELWLPEPWPRTPMGALPARMRHGVRLAVALLHRPAVLLAAHPLDGLEADDRTILAAALAQAAADGVAIVLCDGSAEAAMLADRCVPPANGRSPWVWARFCGSVATLQREASARGLAGRWRVGLRGGACRLGPFSSAEQAREAARWLLASTPPPASVWLQDGEETL